MNKVTALLFCTLAVFCTGACANGAYDLSRGVDREITLFTDEVSIPLGDVGPLTPQSFLDKAGMGDMIQAFAGQDEDGYLVVEQEESFFTSNPVLSISYFLPDPTQPIDLPADDYAGDLGSTGLILTALGLSLSPQVFSLRAGNPITDGIAVSGKLTLTSEPEGSVPAETILSQEFSKARVGATTAAGEILRVECSDAQAFYGCRLENLMLHLPGSLVEKDPNLGFSSFSLSYHYRAYLSITGDFLEGLTFDLNDLNIPLAKYQVKEARIRTEVSSEIPITLEIGSVEALVKQTDEEGKESVVVSEDVSVSPNLRIDSGSSGNPVVSPLEIVIKAQTGTIPDISGLRLTFSVKAPTGAGDKRLNMQQSIRFNNIRATVSGGITIQGL